MAKLKKRELDMILAVTEPGEELDSNVISDRIFEKYGERYSNRQIGLAISWNLNTRFEKERDSQRRYVFTKIEGAVF